MAAVTHASAANLRGVTDLMNLQNVQPDIDLLGAEAAAVGQTGAPGLPLDVGGDTMKLITPDIMAMAQGLGINTDEFDDLSVKVAPAPAAPAASAASAAPTSASLGEPIGPAPTAPYVPPAKTPAWDATPAEPAWGGTSGAPWDNDSDQDDSDDDSDSEQDDDSSDAPSLDAPEVGADHHRRVGGTSTGFIPGGEMETRTREQESRAHIDAVLGEFGGRGSGVADYALDREQEDDLKAQKLDHIDNLVQNLEEEGITVSTALPTINSSMAEIDGVQRRLQLKNDRIRGSSLAEEIIIGGAEALQTFFDGSRQIPVLGFAPDYRGYSNTVGVKLRRMRHETSTLVGDAMRRWNVGPLTRLLLELAPSFFLYPRQNRSRAAAKEMYSREQIASSAGVIRDRHNLENI